MSYRKTILKVQQLLLDAGAEVKIVPVPQQHLEDSCQATDLIVSEYQQIIADHKIKVFSDARGRAIPIKVANVIYEHILQPEFKRDPGGCALQGYDEDDEAILIGCDVNDDERPCVRVERYTDLNQQNEGVEKMTFKSFLSEARKSGISIKEEKTKGVVTKVIAELEGHEAGKLTKVARQYHNILKALKKLEEKKDELNKNLKDMIGDTFDPEEDKYLTRVLASAHFAATLAKETKPEDVAEKVEVKYELLVDGLMKLLTDDLKPAGEALLEACTRRWKPEPKSPNLLVKKLDEGIADTLRSWWRGIKKTLDSALARFDKNLPKLEKQLAEWRSMPKPKVVKEGKFKQFMAEEADDASLKQLKQLSQPIGINGGSYTYWVDVTKSPLKFVASDGSEVDEAKTLEDIAKWMDKWAADIWLDFLRGDEELDYLQEEGIIRQRKGRGDQQEHESE